METSFSGLLGLLPAYLTERLFEVFRGAPLLDLVLELSENVSACRLQRILEYGLPYKGLFACSRWMIANLLRISRCHLWWSSRTHFENLKVKELDFYLKEHGLTTIGRKLDKAGKSYTMSLLPTHKLESVNTDESCGTKDESDGESGDEEYEEEFGSEEDESDNDFFSTIWMRRVTLHRQCSSYQMTKYVKLLFKVHET